MNYESYITWKKWTDKDFGLVTPGSWFSFDQTFKGKVREKSKILEVGFGNGELLGYFSSQGHQVAGVEINDALVSRAKISGYEAYSGAVWNITELESVEFDLIVSFAVAEHMTYEDLLAFFLWARDHLDDAGAMYLKFPEGASPLGLGYQNGDFTHVSCLTKTKIEQLCVNSNMKLQSYSDEPLVSNTLCTYGSVGKLILLMLQGYANIMKWSIRILLYPLSPTLRLGTNSVAVITPHKAEL